MSRLEVGSYKQIKTFQYFTSTYKNILKERDKSFYKKNDDDDNFAFVINKYSGDDYWCLNDYLRDGIVQSEKKILMKVI